LAVTDENVDLSGASNLPAGAILVVNIYDYIGEGSKIFNDDLTVELGKNGLFEVAIHPKKGLKFRTNLLCDVIFMPSYPQPKSVEAVIGARGERLGSSDANPQIGIGSGTHYLEEFTVVRD